MTRFITFFVTALLLASASLSHAIESLAFDVLETNKGIEVRRYAPHMLATVRVAADFKEAGSEAFRPLFDFISGDNASAEKIAMTAPVLQQPGAEAAEGSQGRRAHQGRGHNRCAHQGRQGLRQRLGGARRT